METFPVYLFGFTKFIIGQDFSADLVIAAGLDFAAGPKNIPGKSPSPLNRVNRQVKNVKESAINNKLIFPYLVK